MQIGNLFLEIPNVREDDARIWKLRSSLRRSKIWRYQVGSISFLSFNMVKGLEDLLLRLVHPADFHDRVDPRVTMGIQEFVRRLSGPRYRWLTYLRRTC